MQWQEKRNRECKIFENDNKTDVMSAAYVL